MRKAAVKGLFYPSEKEELISFLKPFQFKQESKIAARGAILPHAGYPFSGKVAAETIVKIKPPKNIIMLGPNHHLKGKSFSLSPELAWEAPCGPVPVNRNLAEKIVAAGSEIEFDSLAHKKEHSLEVQLPILQYFFKTFSIVPISCCRADSAKYRQVASQIKKGIANCKDSLIIATSDLTHYEPEGVARKKDRRIIEAIIELDPEKFIIATEKNKSSACGTAALAILLFILQDQPTKAELTLYQTSADSGSNPNSVVGYAGIILH